MDDQVTSIYCLTDEFLLDLGHQEPPECAVSDAEVLTVALTAMRFFGGNYAAAWRFLLDHGDMRRGLSRGRFGRRLERALPLAEQLFCWLGALWKRTGEEAVFVVDSMPFACCENIRIPRSRLYPLQETEGAFRGYSASKRRFFYGVKAHVVVNEQGLPVEAHLAPGSYSAGTRANDTAELKNFALDLPSGSVVYGDIADVTSAAYGNDYLTEDLLAEAGEVELVGTALVLAWVTTEAVRTKNRSLALGGSLAAFMSELGLERGGETSTRLREQMRRLFAARIAIVKAVQGMDRTSVQVASHTRLWWDESDPSETLDMGSTIVAHLPRELPQPRGRDPVDGPRSADGSRLRRDEELHAEGQARAPQDQARLAGA